MSLKDTNVGKDTEQRLARYFRAEGWAGAERRVRTGFRNAHRSVADQGDLTGMPGLCIQAKSLRSKDKRHAGSDPNAAAERMVPTWLLEVEEQREASRSVLGLLVVRRWGTTDVGRWWCFLDLATLYGLLAGDPEQYAGGDGADVPVRLELAHVVGILKAQGWGANDDVAVAG